MIRSNSLPTVYGPLQERRGGGGIKAEFKGLIGRNKSLKGAAGVPMTTLGAHEETGDNRERKKHSACASDEEKLAPLTIDQHNASDGHQELDAGEEDVAPVSADIGETALYQQAGVIGSDGVDTCGRIAEENRAREQERNDVSAPQDRSSEALAEGTSGRGGREG